ncbi:volume-regulated anion channel subunit LRRC8A-like [Paramuricea clavata]|uniref:Volume-regulated anion channel subunit LRRC8A-like n=1 Tax=Paramuricea clavata TaxID=317549 RepID=A0A6S7HZT1_PARCT|nr:volume-regulated anion channel subunit LRRC8A-like [Paramuricea clavata]
MFALSDVARFEGEKEKCKIVKTLWDVLTDYLVMFLLMLSVLFAGMEITLGGFECLAAVDCPGISRSNTSSSLFSHNTNRNVCEAFYASQTTNIIKRTDVLTDLSLPYAKFVNSKCSKSAIPDFLSYLSIVLFFQAFFLIVLDNMWLKLPTTASVIEHFATLVIACYNSPYQIFESTQAVSKIPVSRRQWADDPEQNGQDINRKPISDRNNDILDDPATLAAVQTLYEKVQLLKKTTTKTSKIWRLYLVQAILQALSTFTFILIDSFHIKHLKETMTCSITQYIPVPHDYFVCSHSLALAFTYGLYLYIIILGVSFVIFAVIIIWTVFKVVNNECTYTLENEQVKTVADIPAVKKDLGFLLHLLHSYNYFYVHRLVPFLSESNKKKITAYSLMQKHPVSKLQIQLNENGNKLTFINCQGIPQTIFELATEIVVLELIECSEPLEKDDFNNFSKLTSLRELSVVKCGLDSIPEGILKIEWLEVLNLKGNSITSIEKSISELKNLNKLDLSDNGLKTIVGRESLKELDRLFEVNLLGNPNLNRTALQVVLACKNLGNLRYPKISSDERNQLNQEEKKRFDTAVKFAMEETSVIPFTPENAPHINLRDNEEIYEMDSNPIKGIAIIFNMYSYAEYRTRVGSDKDVAKLKSLFEKIGFETKCCIDYKAEKATKVLEKCAKDTKYRRCGCIAVIVMCHGSEKGLIFHDGETVPVMDLVKCVQKSQLYNGKPKLFFIQAFNRNSYYRSTSTSAHPLTPSPSNPSIFNSISSDINTDINTSSDETLAPKQMVGAGIPNQDHIVLSYSAGHKSYRNIEYGSWFVQALVETFSRHAWEEDILSLLTLVNYKVVRAYTSRGWRQVPAPQSTLRKKLYLLPGYPKAPPKTPTPPPQTPTPSPPKTPTPSPPKTPTPSPPKTSTLPPKTSTPSPPKTSTLPPKTPISPPKTPTLPPGTPTPPPKKPTAPPQQSEPTAPQKLSTYV